MTYEELCKKQVEWYIANGKYPIERIARDGDGVNYVIGDSSWNQIRLYGQHESIERDKGFRALSGTTQRAADAWYCPEPCNRRHYGFVLSCLKCGHRRR